MQTLESEFTNCKSGIFIDTKVIDMDAEVMLQMGQKPGTEAFSEEHEY